MEDLYNSAIRKLSQQKKVNCNKCEDGSGKKGAGESFQKFGCTDMEIKSHQMRPEMAQ